MYDRAVTGPRVHATMVAASVKLDNLRALTTRSRAEPQKTHGNPLCVADGTEAKSGRLINYNLSGIITLSDLCYIIKALSVPCREKKYNPNAKHLN